MELKKKRKINVCVCTLAENRNLNKLITDLCDFRESNDFEIVVTVIVNKPSVETLNFPRFVRVFFESKRGYSSVRNRALIENLPEHDLIFIDDDEIVSKGWLFEFCKAAEIFPGEILLGSVKPANLMFPSYRKRTWKSYNKNSIYTLLGKAPCNNLFIPYPVLNSPNCFFDTYFNLGGEDTDFTMRLVNSGVRIRWIPTAELVEIQDAERFEHLWINARIMKDYQNFAIAFRRNHSLISIFIQIILTIRNIVASASLFAFNFEMQVRLKGNLLALRALLTGKWKG